MEVRCGSENPQTGRRHFGTTRRNVKAAELCMFPHSQQWTQPPLHKGLVQFCRYTRQPPQSSMSQYISKNASLSPHLPPPQHNLDPPRPLPALQSGLQPHLPRNPLIALPSPQTIPQTGRDPRTSTPRTLQNGHSPILYLDDPSLRIGMASPATR